jgi:serine/threonine-protein kinase
LYESYVSSATDTEFSSSGSVAIWDLDKTYPANYRGDVCTSADAGGLPIAPMLFSADEVASGKIEHAIRLILPNARIQNKTYVRPATHGTGGASWAQTNGVPYGARLRLRADYPVENLPASAQVVARALQDYGMILADGGSIALTAQSDRGSTAKWDGLLGSRDLAALKVTDFEIVDSGPQIPFTEYDCVRTP